MNTIFGILEHSARAFPDKIALSYGGKSYTYAELLAESSQVSRFIAAQCSPQDVIALYMENCDDWVVSYFGILGAGCICNSIGIRTSDENMQFQLSYATPAFIVTSSRMLEKCQRLGLDKRHKLITPGEIRQQSDGFPFLPKADKRTAEYSTLMYTSGTTGMPKAIRLRHRTALNAARNILDYLKLRYDDVYYGILPLSHSFGLGNLHATLLAGGSVALAENTINLKHILAEIKKYKATFFAAVPLTLTQIAEHFLNDLREGGDSLRLICTNTGPMPPHITTLLLGNLPKAHVYTYYGLTEASRSSFMHYNLYPDKLTSVGRPTPNVRIAIFDKLGNEAEQGALGEICIQGDHLIDEYWKNQEATAKQFRNSWFYTGDIGYKDKDGFLYIAGRDDDIINIGGEKVSLCEIDQAVQRLDFVADAAAIERQDGRQEYTIKVFVVLNPKMPLAQSDKEMIAKKIIAYCRERLENFKVPQEVIFTNSIPRTESGKLKRKELRFISLA